MPPSPEVDGGPTTELPEPWFCRPGLVLRISVIAIAAFVVRRWLLPGSWLFTLAAWSALIFAVGLLAFVVKARRTYARAQLTYPPPMHRPALYPYLFAALLAGLVSWMALKPAPKQPPRYQGVRSGSVAGDIVGNGASIILHTMFYSLERSAGRAVSGVLLIGLMSVVVLPMLCAHAIGRIQGYYSGLAAASIKPALPPPSQSSPPD